MLVVEPGECSPLRETAAQAELNGEVYCYSGIASQECMHFSLFPGEQHPANTATNHGSTLYLLFD